jgi:hypothetical protein
MIDVNCDSQITWEEFSSFLVDVCSGQNNDF